jgi:hypothetical protein
MSEERDDSRWPLSPFWTGTFLGALIGAVGLLMAFVGFVAVVALTTPPTD